MPLTKHVAVITGASSGIGLAVAHALAAEGCRLVITARREDRLIEQARKLGECAHVAGDITDPALPQKLIDTAVQRFGHCDICFNNAGNIEVGPIETIDIDRVCQMVRINVEAAYRMAYTAVRHFKAQNHGHLVNTSSILGTKVRPTAGAYAGTKFAIEALSEALRMELARTDVKVSCIEPGLVTTELHKEWPTHPSQSMNIQHPLTPDDVARCVLFILKQPAHVRIPTLLVLPKDQEL